jgi:hypothetical protein
MSMPMYHLSVCIQNGGIENRNAFVISAETETKAVAYAETFTNRLGYCGNSSFAEAVKRCGMMERNEANAWGIIR